MADALPSFDTLLLMARQDPEGLEQLRQRLCEQIISRHADEHRQQRLRGLVWRIEQERRRARTPLAACVRMHGLMLDAMQQLNDAFNNPPATPAGEATILPFDRPE